MGVHGTQAAQGEAAAWGEGKKASGGACYLLTEVTSARGNTVSHARGPGELGVVYSGNDVGLGVI